MSNSSDIEIYNNTVKLVNSTSPSKFHQVNSHQKLVLRMLKCVFHKEKLNAIDTVYEKYILSFSKPVFWGTLTWRNLKGLVELTKLTVIILLPFVSVKLQIIGRWWSAQQKKTIAAQTGSRDFLRKARLDTSYVGWSIDFWN